MTRNLVIKIYLVAFFLTSDLKKSQIAKTIRHNSKRIISREAFRDSDGKYNHDNFVHWNNQFQREIFLAKEKRFLVT